MHKRATRKPPPAFSAPKPNRPPSRPRSVCNRRRSAHRRAELLEAARCRRAPSRARAGEPLRERLSTPFAPPSRSPASSFAHLKRILRLDRLRLRGPSGAKDEFLLAATAPKTAETGVAPAVIHQAVAAAYAGRGVCAFDGAGGRPHRKGRRRRCECRHAQAEFGNLGQ